MNIVVLLGTVRKGRQSEKPYRVILDLLKKKGAEVVAVDCADLDLPRFDGERYEHAGVKLLTSAVAAADAIIVVTPEYNHFIPGVLKDAIDFCRKREIMSKPLATVGVSSGAFGGVRAIKQLEAIWIGSKGIVLPVFLPTPMIEQFDEQNPPTDWLAKAESFVDLAIQMFTVIAEGKKIVAK
ncbi:MAG: NAD(P)H-dependent oxidoreductase [Patescibacteria group bacterium]|jgi:NAD(P)H-dependent FMN reductase